MPVLTTSYSAAAEDPPEYPEVALITPRTCWKTACTPQKQPPASTAVCCPLAWAKAVSSFGFGKSAPPPLTAGACFVAITRVTTSTNANTITQAKRPARVIIGTSFPVIRFLKARKVTFFSPIPVAPGHPRQCFSGFLNLKLQIAHEQPGQDAAQERAHHGHQGVAPIGMAFARYRPERVGDARPQVAGGINGVAGGATQRQPYAPHQAGHEIRT